MRILVTGGAGFLGSHLCDTLLASGHTVICMDNLFTGSQERIVHMKRHPRFEFMHHDIQQPFHMEVDQIYNLACPASPVHYQSNPIQTTQTSVIGTTHCLELARLTGARLLQASTSEVYGDPLIHPQTEDYWGNVNPIGPRSCYDEGKRCAESLCMDYNRYYQVPIRIVRIFNTYGPRMHPEDGRVVSNFVVSALKQMPLTLYGKGTQTRSFCFVSDLIAGIVAAMNHPTLVEPINLGNPNELTVGALAQYILELTGSSSQIVHKPLPENDPQRRRPCIQKAKKCLDWEPTVSLEEGLSKTVDYFKQTLSL